MVDAQLDELQQQVLGISFNPMDMPPGEFVLAGEAWQMCKGGLADPDHFGIFEWHGWDFIRGNVVRDLLALNKVEVLPWDFWGLLTRDLAHYNEEELALIEQAARLTLGGDPAFPEIRTLYTKNPSLQVPTEWLDRPG